MKINTFFSQSFNFPIAPSPKRTFERSMDCFQLRFSGRQPELFREMNRRWIPDEEFDDLIRKQIHVLHKPYLGILPPELATCFKSEDDAFHLMNSIAEKRGVLDSTDVSNLLKPIGVSYLKSGDDGDVYKININNREYALKIFKHDGIYGMLGEFQALTFLNGQGAKDIMKAYMCGFSGPKNWILSEFIPSDPPFTAKQLKARGHSSIARIAKQHKILIGYGYDRVNSILVDAGYIMSFDPSYDDLSRFEQGISMCRYALKQAYRKGNGYTAF